jgi:Chaperone of endosialidase
LSIDLSAYAPLTSPVFAGNPTAPTPTAGDNDTSIATTAFVNTKAGNYLPLTGGTLTGNLTISSAGAVVVQSTTASSSPTTGALTVAGGLGIKGGIYSSSDNAAVRGLTIDGDTNNTGWIGLRSKAGVENWVFGQAGYSNQDFSIVSVTGASATALDIRRTDNSVWVRSGVASTSPTTGALTVAGGVGVGGALNVGNQLKVSNATNENFLVTGHSSLSSGNRIGSLNDLGSAWGPLEISSQTYISMTTASSSPTTGALTVAGGLGVSGNVYCGGGGFKPAGGPWSDSSDARIKTVVSDYEHGLAEVLQLAPKRYTYKGNDTVAPTTATKLPYEDSPHYSVAIAGTEYIGLIAQEVETVMPEMVTLATGYIDGKNKIHNIRRLDTGALIYALVNSIKELHARVQALEGAAV